MTPRCAARSVSARVRRVEMDRRGVESRFVVGPVVGAGEGARESGGVGRRVRCGDHDEMAGRLQSDDGGPRVGGRDDRCGSSVVVQERGDGGDGVGIAGRVDGDGERGAQGVANLGERGERTRGVRGHRELGDGVWGLPLRIVRTARGVRPGHRTNLGTVSVSQVVGDRVLDTSQGRSAPMWWCRVVMSRRSPPLTVVYLQHLSI